MHIGIIAILFKVIAMTKKEKMKQIRQAEKLAALPKLNPDFKPGRRSYSEIYQGIIRNKYVNEWAD
jgi:hypothetical protein